jgi:hypothetical protein
MSQKEVSLRIRRKFKKDVSQLLHIDDPMKTESSDAEYIEKWIDAIEENLARVS